MSKSLNSRRLRKVEKAGDFKKIKSIVLVDKELQNLSRATIINHNISYLMKMKLEKVF